MAFEGLAEKLQAAFQKLNNRGKLTEKDVKDAMREVRMALLEADVNYLVVKDFVKRVTDRAVGEEIFTTLNAGQTVIKIVREEMTALMGGTQAKLVICRCGSPIEHKAQRIRRRLKYSAGSDDRLSGGRSGRFVRSSPGQRPPAMCFKWMH